MNAKNLLVGATKVALFPPANLFSEVSAALSNYTGHPFASPTIKRLAQSEAKQKKCLTELIRESEKANASTITKPHLELSGYAGDLKASSQSLELLLKRHLSRADLVALHQTHTGPEAVAEALLKACKRVGNADVKAVASIVQRDMEAHAEAAAREEAGGHVALTPAQATVAVESWKSIDAGFSVLEICLRDADVTYDAVLADQPNPRKNPLRRVVSRVPPSEKPVMGRPKGKPKAKGSPAGGSTPSTAPSKG
jgi:hypothetical protein